MKANIGKADASAGAEDRSILVWDLGVRAFHWSLVLTVATCAYTGFIAPSNWLNVHFLDPKEKNGVSGSNCFE
jgi:Ni,Fe-hydrogenase I cytochrome b subunit